MRAIHLFPSDDIVVLAAVAGRGNDPVGRRHRGIAVPAASGPPKVTRAVDG